jgi:hypothetical protein
LFEEVSRLHAKWRASKRRDAGTTTDSSWPQIRIVPGELPRVVNEAETALIGLGREMYQRSGLIVRPVLSKLVGHKGRETEGWQLIPVTSPHLVETLTCAAQFLKFDRRSNSWTPTDAPVTVADTYLARQGHWNLPSITGVTSAPFLRGDGSVCTIPGHDAATGILYKPGCDFETVPGSPTKDDAMAALALLEDLISEFPFVTPADRAVALSVILTALDRCNMLAAPMHAFTAPSPGAGKSKLMDMAAAFLTGRRAPVIAQGNTEEELEKRLGAKLLTGDLIIAGAARPRCFQPTPSDWTSAKQSVRSGPSPAQSFSHKEKTTAWPAARSARSRSGGHS